MNIPLNISWQQILLHLFNFAILAGGLHFLLYKPVKNFMQQRAQYYQDMKDKAEGLLQEAEKLKETREEQLRGIDQELQEKRLQAQESLSRAAAQQRENAEAEAAAVLEKAKQSAEEYREKALRDSQKELQDLAVLAAKKLVYASGESAIDQFLDAAEGENTHGTNGL